MLNQILALGLRDWHAVWAPVKTWADHHQDHNGTALQFFASVTTVVGLPVLTVLTLAALAFLVIDRADAKRRRAVQRRAILLGLRTELEGTRDTASQDVMALAAGEGVALTVLPLSGVEQALIEAGLLDLTPEQIAALHEVRLRILRANSLVHATCAVPGSAVGTRPELVRGERDGLYWKIQNQFEAITGLCDSLLARLNVA